MPELVFLAPAAADRAAGLVAALAEQVGRQDAAALLAAGQPPPPRPDRVYVAVQGDGEAGDVLEADRLARTVLVLAAPPGGERFARGVELAQRAGMTFHVNAAAIPALHEAAIPARHLQLGLAPGGDEQGPEARLEVLGGRGGYVDWVATLAAIEAGAAVLHEEALGLAPLVADRHLFVGPADSLEALAAGLRGEPERLRQVREEARAFLREALPLALAAAALIGAARALVAQPLPAATVSSPGHSTSRSK